MATSKSTATCPHCGKESERRALTSINIDQNPEMREQVRTLSCFRWECPNCGVTSLVVDPCLYHDMSYQFLVGLSPEGAKPEDADFERLSGYTMRYVADLNAFREKITILERGLDDRAVEIMKLILFMQIRHDLDVVELLYHELDERTGDLRFVAVLSDGVEQYIAMSGQTYQRIAEDVRTRLYSRSRTFQKIDLEWAQGALELLQA